MKSPIAYFLEWEKKTPNQVFLRQPKGKTWKEITYKETAIEVRKLLQVLKDMGLKKGDHIGILSKNCYHWIIADLAISLGGYISVPYYASLPKDQLKEVIEKSDEIETEEIEEDFNINVNKNYEIFQGSKINYLHDFILDLKNKDYKVILFCDFNTVLTKLFN